MLGLRCALGVAYGKEKSMVGHDLQQDKRMITRWMKGEAAARRTTPLAALCLTGFLAACGGGPADVVPMTEAEIMKEKAKTMDVVAPQIVSALCAGQAQEVVDFLSSEPISSSIDKMYLALALETVGDTEKAVAIYDELGSLNSLDPILIRCENAVSVLGEVSEVARYRAERRRLLDQTLDQYRGILAAAQAQLAFAQEAPKGDRMVAKASGTKDETKPPAQPAKTAQKSPDRPKPKGPIAVTRPSSASLSGFNFAHFQSYRDVTKLQSAIRALEAQYPALRGGFSDWEVNAGGRQTWRVGVRTIDILDAEALCRQVTDAGNYCRVLDMTP